MRIVSVLLVCILSAISPANEFHVAPSGSDTNSGAESAPFATLAKARDAVRVAGAGPHTVWLHDGVYVQGESFALTAKDSGTAEAPVSWRALNAGGARIQGGQAIGPDAFGPVAEPALARLPEAARSAVVRADLSGVGALGEYPEAFRTPVAMPELYFNGARMTLAQWPNEGWAEIDTIVESGPAPWREHASDKLGVFTYSGDYPSRWAGVKDLWLEGYWCFDWASETIRVKSVDPATGQITLGTQHVYGIGSGNPAPRRYRAVNLLEELDGAGEYYIDRDEKALYFWPPAALEGAEIVLSLATEPLLTLTDVAHVTLAGLTFEYAAGNAVTVTGGENVTLAGSTIRNAGLVGAVVEGGANHTVRSCDFYNNGTGGLSISGGDRKTLTPSGHKVINNHIYRVSERMRTAAYNLVMGGVGVYVAHNEISDAPHQAILCSGNDHIFEYNDIHHVSMNSDDCGAFYMGRNPSDRGTRIRYNYWHEIGSKMAHGSCAIYFDDGDGGQIVHGNVFYKAAGGRFGAVFNHGGHDNVVTNNIFVSCDLAMGAAPWHDGMWKEWLHGDLWRTRLLEEVDITKPPFTERYPDLKGFMDYEGGLRLNHSARNVAVACKNLVNGNWTVSESFTTNEDVGFVDYPNQDFTLKEDAMLFTQIPGFERIPFGEIGLKVDEYRKAAE